MNYNTKNSSYYSNVRHDLIKLIPRETNDLKVLEIGAAYGETLHYLKEKNIAKEAVGIELYEDSEKKGVYKPIDQFIFGNINELELEEFKNYFDLVILADVLEHIIEPEITLKKVFNLLKPKGQILVSIPNIRHYSAINKIVFQGDFRYEESGLFDYTHVKFYCKKNIIKLIESSRFSIVKIESSIKNYKGKSLAKTLNKATFGLFQTFFTYQYYLRAKKVS